LRAWGDRRALPMYPVIAQPLRITVNVKGARPEKPIARAAAGVRSITRPRTNGPRSLIRTITDWPLRRFVTRTRVPNGRDRWAAVIASLRTRSPDADRRP